MTLTPTEYELLRVLAQGAGRVLTHEALLRQVWAGREKANPKIAQAIANRQSEIDRLQAEIKALTDVEQILGASAPAARSTSRRSSSPTKAAAAADSKSEPKPARKRREMSAAENEGGIGAHDRLLGRTEEEGGQEVAPPAHRGPGWDGSRLT